MLQYKERGENWKMLCGPETSRACGNRVFRVVSGGPAGERKETVYFTKTEAVISYKAIKI